MKKYIIYISSFLAVSFLTYCFFPVITYNSNKEPGAIFLKDRNGIVITDKGNEYGYKKDININLKSQFVNDLLKIEDKNYYSHFGVDLYSKLGAIKSNIINGKVVSGGSTITEQYIKNKYFLNNKRTYLQKSRESFLSVFNTLFLYNRDEILTNYLNDIYFGNNLYGIGAATEVYFGKQDLNDLTSEEITLLISLIHNPGIESLEEKSFRQYFQKIQNKLGYSFERKIYKLNKKENIDKFPFVTINKDRFYISPLSRGMPKGQGDKWQGDTVSIDSKLQQYASDILNKTLKELKSKNVTNGAIFAINPKTKEVLIYQGSRDFNSNEIDGQVDVIQSLRQPGSSMKPFLYLMALQNGANPDDLVLDLNNNLNSFKEGKTYISNNYSLNEYGLIRFKKALGNSLNNASVRLAKELGLNKVLEFYKQYGFKLEQSADYYGYSLVLGNPSIKLEDLVWSYSRLLSNPSPRTSVLPLEKGDYNVEQSKFLLYDILSDSDNRDLSFGVNSILNTSIPQAVKTGTSSDFRDNVIVSYHPDFVMGIWIGNNDNSSMIGVTGITGAGYIWHNIIEKAIEIGYIKDKKIEVPKGIIQSDYCLDEKCFRKKLVYKKYGKEYYSRIADNRYSAKDLFEKLSSDEVDRLKDFQMYLDE